MHDHVAYWANRDQFLSLLISHLMKPSIREAAGLPPAADLATDDAELKRIGTARQSRVRIRRAIQWIAVVSAFLAVLRDGDAWVYFFRYVFERALSAGAAILGLTPPPVVAVAVDWSGPGLARPSAGSLLDRGWILAVVEQE